MNNPFVSIIIPSYNGKDLTVNLLESLKKTKYKNYEIVVVDNGSNDGCYEHVKKNYPYVRAVKVEINNGVTGGLNAGIKKSKGDYLVMMNNDMLVTPGWLSHLVKAAASDDNIGIVGYTFLEFDKKKEVVQRFGYSERNKILLKFKAVGKSEPYDSGLPEIIGMSHAFGLVKKEVIQKIGTFDEKLFMSWDEADLCYRAGKAGYRTVVATKSKIYHIGGMTVKKAPYTRAFHYHKNRIRFILKNLSLFRKLVNLPLTLVYYLIESAFYFARGDVQMSVSILNSILWNFKNIRDYL